MVSILAIHILLMLAIVLVAVLGTQKKHGNRIDPKDEHLKLCLTTITLEIELSNKF